MAPEENRPPEPIELLDRLFNEASVGVLVTTADGRIVMANPAALRSLDIPAEKLLDRSIDECASGVGRGASYLGALGAALGASISSGQPLYQQTLTLLGPDSEHCIGYSTFLLPEGSGAIAFTETTATARLDRERNEAESLAQVSRVASWMAHELRNPLATIQMYAGILAGKAGPEAQDAVGVIRQQIQLAQSRISEILYAAAASSFATREPAVVDMATVLRTYLEDELAELGHIQVKMWIPAGTHWVPLTSEDARLMVSSLANNSVEAIEGKGEICITVASREDSVRLTVDDTGSGFPEGWPERLMRPFFTSKPRGTGLGLWLVKRIVERSRGNLVLSTNRQGGARVRITLPRISPGSLRGSTVVVVENEPSVRRLICRQLEEFGAVPMPAADGAQAIELLGTHPGLLVTALELPGLDGLQLAKHANRGIPALIISDRVGGASEAPVPNSKGIAFLSRPFDASDLGLALSYLLWESQ